MMVLSQTFNRLQKPRTVCLSICLIIAAIISLSTSWSHIRNYNAQVTRLSLPSFRTPITPLWHSQETIPLEADETRHRPPNWEEYERLSHMESAGALWAKLKIILDDNDPHVPGVATPEKIDFTGFNPEDKTYVEDILKIKPAHLIRLRDAHRDFVTSMQKAFSAYTPPKNSARRGIVMTASSYYLPVAMVSIGMLRRTGSQLPIEIWLKDREEYEQDLCERVAPGVNARCFVMEDIFRRRIGKKPLKSFVKFEYKILAILFSAFEEVLFMDADCVALEAPELLFDDDPYRRTGMVMWPDLWRTAVSPAFYLINGQKEHPLGMRAASESGQMMFNKRTHFQALLLAAYYNYYGESHYYTLLSQNGPGRGDKETFVPAAESLELPYWQVRQRVETVGHDFGDIFGAWWLAMVQWDPMQDFHRQRNAATTGNVFNKTLPPQVPDFDSFDDDELPRMFFLHCNTRKWNPRDVLDYVGGYDLAWDLEGRPVKDPYGYPPELGSRLEEVQFRLWEQVRWLACDAKVDFRDWEGTREEICERVYRYFFTVIDPKDDVEPYVPPQNEEFQRWVHEEKARYRVEVEATTDDHNEEEGIIQEEEGGEEEREGDVEEAGAGEAVYDEEVYGEEEEEEEQDRWKDEEGE